MENYIKIVFDVNEKTNNFFIKNGKQEWVPVSPYSRLASEEVLLCDINKDAKIVLNILNDDYCRKGILYILLEGYDKTDEFIKAAGVFDNISVEKKNFSVAVMGKIKSGKTTLIEAFNGVEKEEKKNSYRTYLVDNNLWFDVKGIDLGKSYYEESYELVKKLHTDFDLAVLIYCIDSKGGKIESLEEELLNRILSEIGLGRVIIAITNSIDEDKSIQFARHVEKLFANVCVVPLLAKNEETRVGTIQAWGLNKLNDAIYGGI